MIREKPEILNIPTSKFYKMPTKVYFGRGSFNQVFQITKNKKTLFVVGSHFDKSILSKGEVYDEIKKSDFDSVNNLANFISKNDFDCLVAIGGGTILDSVKAANLIAANGGKAKDYLISKKREIKNKGTFLIAIPTTSGTGSEVTPWAVIWGDKKYSLQSDLIFPDVAIVDPTLTDSTPKKVTAESGIDALCQSVEAYWNVKHNPTSDKYALGSIKTIFGSLEKAVNNHDKKSGDQMAWGSLLGGLAFSNTQTTICHAVSYPITSHFGIAHGQATSITLPLFIDYIFPDMDEERRNKILFALSAKNTDEASERIRKLMKSVGLKTDLSELGISKKDISMIVAEGFDPTRAKNSPKIPTEEELSKMLLSIL